MGRPFIVKPNRGGKGTGVTLVRNASDVDQVAASFDDYTLDGTVVLQDYAKPADGRVLRLEFIGGGHYYTVSIDTGGGFDLCPSDACQVGSTFCPADGAPSSRSSPTMRPPMWTGASRSSPIPAWRSRPWRRRPMQRGAAPFLRRQHQHQLQRGGRSPFGQRTPRHAGHRRIPR